MKRSTLFTIAAVIAVGLLFFYMTTARAHQECNVCVEFQGRSNCAAALGSTVAEATETAHRTAYSEIPRSRFVRKASLVDYPHKLIVNVPPRESGEPAFELYDLEADPAEASDRAALDPERAERMRAALDAQRGARDRNGRADFDRPTQSEAQTERLRALGYVE